tara:strand:- start:759 stop:1184 length:426 start_codon:yes stop_codon:yes gene_type:complete
MPRQKGAKAKGSGDWKDTFLSALRVAPVIRQACKRAGISRAEAYRERHKDINFAQQWQEALNDGIDEVELALHIRARKQDTTAAIFLLKNLRPEVYGENVNLNVSGSLSIQEIQSAQKSLDSKLKQITKTVAPGHRLVTDG